MQNPAEQPLVISGIGVTSAVGVGKAAFAQALREGRSAFGLLSRPGRRFQGPQGEIAFVGAEIEDDALPSVLDARNARTASWCGRVAVATLAEAWDEAALGNMPPERVGLVLGGSNLQQRELANLHDDLAQRRHYVRPSLAPGFLDTDVLALCCERFGIRGASFACAAASASGQLGVIQAALAVQSGQVDVCIALGGLMDLSFWELQALRSAGAMGGEAFAEAHHRACRPFDVRRDGFIYGESCAALVIERENGTRLRAVTPYARLAGWSVVNDASRGTSPSLRGEVDVLTRALQNSGTRPEDVDYYNAHGTGSIVGDEIELQALHQVGLAGAFVNATKSITGHGLTAAGAVEIAATLLQMKGGWLHPTLNLEQPIDSNLRWITGSAQAAQIELAVSLSLGFGGFNTAVCLRNDRLD